MIACPKCGADSAVIETRATSAGARRRRHCDAYSCGEKFSTLELVVPEGKLAAHDVVLVPRQLVERLHTITGAALGGVTKR